MKALLRLLPAVALATALIPTALAAHTHSPTPATWKLNVAASDFGGGPVMKSDEMSILVDTEKWLKFTDVTVDGDGKTWNISWSGPQDGTLKPVVGMKGATASFKTADDSSHFVYPDGSVVDSTFSMSADKKKVTMTGTFKTKDGKSFHQTLVYDRIK